MSRSIFQNQEHELHFRKHGFTIVPFFSSNELQEADKLCKQLNGGFDTQFTTTIWSNDAEYRKAVYRELKKIYVAPAQRVLANCKLVMATILTKHPGENSAIDIHQDWAFTDEEKNAAVNIWVPLVDTNKENGALCFLPCSHLFKVPYRGRHITPQFADVKNIIWQLGQVCCMKAGEALIFDVRMVHYSNPNISGQIRTATAMVAIPQEADIIHYINFNPRQNILTEMKVDELFYNAFSHNDTIPKMADSREFEFERTQLNEETFKKEYELLCRTAQQL